MHLRRSRYLRHRFPSDIISHAVWLYHRYCLSFRDVEDLLAERRPPATPVPLTWASVPEDYDVQLKALRRHLDISQAGFARLVGAAGKAVVYQAVWTSCARPKVLGCGTRWDKAGRMRDTPRCLLGFFVAPTADGGSRLLVGVVPPFGDFRGGVDGF